MDEKSYEYTFIFYLRYKILSSTKPLFIVFQRRMNILKFIMAVNIEV